MAKDKMEKGGGIWGAVKVIAIIVILAGIATALYSAYSLLSFGSAFGGFPRTGPRGNFVYNQSGYNQSGFNQSGFAASGSSLMRYRLFASPDAVVIGILLIILGFVSFKYAQLKAGM